jgi:hypothetical protein
MTLDVELEQRTFALLALDVGLERVRWAIAN